MSIDEWRKLERANPDAKHEYIDGAGTLPAAWDGPTSDNQFILTVAKKYV